ncbi:MAG: carbohydrate ABC transporter permease [Microbacterium sp.]
MGRYTWRLGVLECFFIACAVVFLVPIVGLVNVALKTSGNTSTALEFEGAYTLANFGEAWTTGRLGNALVNSVVITVLSVALVVLFGALAAYFIARRSGRFPQVLFYAFLLGIVLPAQLGMIPLYRTMIDLGLTGTIWSVVILNVGGGMPFAIFLIATFLRDLPPDYEEAAVIDGASPTRTFFSVVMPLIRPVLGTVAILTAISTWNNFFVPLLYLAGSGYETVPVRLYSFVGQYSSNWPVIFAGLIITVLPILIAFFFLQRAVMNGFSGGVKG